ncbi:DUF423 domain-containing protein [Sphingomonas sp. LaA6.9]|uniref:DUF423 domain-containing protein n=1 Tax=Sphingomonas sp. LaA6.9 TaxID=2919914 RepID=UPI001F4FCB15|nr:DUF423 domain-containing protein [Sphingomonas sp. LaA6.9]MCJ8157627.1 DUF423 domain-containing protein [Sphingomonas sp. LaA6.9]
MLIVLIGLSGALAVAAGAFAAHGASSEAAEWLKTGAFYQLIHTVAALATAEHAGGKGVATLFLVGGAIFALTLYAMAFGAPRWLGAVTPIGGSLMILGWLWLAWLAFRG